MFSTRYEGNLDLYKVVTDPLNAKLNPICHLLALLRAHHILHISRIRVKVYNYQSTQQFIVNYVYYSNMFRLN